MIENQEAPGPSSATHLVAQGGGTGLFRNLISFTSETKGLSQILSNVSSSSEPYHSKTSSNRGQNDRRGNNPASLTALPAETMIFLLGVTLFIFSLTSVRNWATKWRGTSLTM